MWWWDGSIVFSNYELEDVGMVFPHHMVVCSFVSFCVDIPHVHGDL